MKEETKCENPLTVSRNKHDVSNKKKQNVIKSKATVLQLRRRLSELNGL